MEIVFIRHGQTPGNALKRYIGRTDEPLSDYGEAQIREFVDKGLYPMVEEVYVSPLKRCQETADIIYPRLPKTVVPNLKECNFGLFENKNYQELSSTFSYQEWIKTGGMGDFPEGEQVQVFKERCIKGFCHCIEDAISRKLEKIALVIHGGTVMSILDQYGIPKKEYYQWMTDNGCGYVCEMKVETTKKEETNKIEDRRIQCTHITSMHF